MSRWRLNPRLRFLLTAAFALVGLLLAIATFYLLGPLTSTGPENLRAILLADFAYAIILIAIVSVQIARVFASRRAKSVGSRLHMRLGGFFATVALVPTLLVAVMAVVTVNFGLEGWFSERVSRVIGASLSAAEAYEETQRSDLEEDARALARTISQESQRLAFVTDGDLRQILVQAQTGIQRGLREAFVINGSGEIRARGENSYLFDFERPTQDDIAASREANILIIDDWTHDEMRALVPLLRFPDHYLLVSRIVDGDILRLLDETQETAKLYGQLEESRGRLLFEFGLLYLGFAVILLLGATLAGLWFAERLSRPVGQLTRAAQRVGSGDLDVRVPSTSDDDEIAMLGRYFNQMTRQLKTQRETLLEQTSQAQRRGRLFDSVLSSVSSGVLGLNGEGQVQFANPSAERVLHINQAKEPLHLSEAVPEFTELFEQLLASGSSSTQKQIQLIRDGLNENLLVHMATRSGTPEANEGFVIAFEDVSDLMRAQRMAAWGEIARRIAHEIKNPLTPIQLAAEQIKRKFTPKLADDGEGEALAKMTDVIVRQTGDLRRIVEEFSRFARMPRPNRKPSDLIELVREVTLLRGHGSEHVNITLDLPDGPCIIDMDATMIRQALTNIIKNAIESIDMRSRTDDGFDPAVTVALSLEDTGVTLRICDNGVGFPEDRMRLLEPYQTTRVEGTGLGLSIVLKIIEDHDGSLALEDAPPFDNTAHKGAQIVVTLPRAHEPQQADTRDPETPDPDTQARSIRKTDVRHSDR